SHLQEVRRPARDCGRAPGRPHPGGNRCALSRARTVAGQAQRAGLCGGDRARAGRDARRECRGDRAADDREFLSPVCQSAARGHEGRMTLTATILGCGSSTGVPRVGLGWGDADPSNPQNRRRRCSLLVERRNCAGARTCVLVDTSPDLREQLLDTNVEWLDAVLYTHEHADHTHGIDDLRPLTLKRRRRVDVYADVPTSHALNARFGYCFVTPAGSDYPPIVTEHRLEAGRPVTIAGDARAIPALPF